MQLSLSGFLFEDKYQSQSLDFPSFCALARSAGYDGVELRRTQVNLQTSANQRRQLRIQVKNHGLKVTCLTARGMPAAGTERDAFLLDYLDLCRDMGCSLIKIGGDPEWLRWAAEQGERVGVTLASNNHLNGPLETVAGTRTHLAAVAHANYGLLYDSMHLNLTGQDYVGCIPEFYPATRNILVQSLRPARGGESPLLERDGRSWVKDRIDAEGVQTWPAILRTYRNLGYDGLITVIENGWPVEQREQVARHCAAVLHSLWEEE
ncbi:MAG: sugar phosphate isomerase/epimerase [Gemmatimonadetes bacterium]|jgi:sugar phosphate isomerase/epimerase|nr:sugar phosphate isomerase/epimerase [Gemmatimonadota bacterium]